MNGAVQHKEEVLERLKTVFESFGKSSRAFSKSIGLKPTSFHKVLTGTAGLTIPLANSIELNHGFRSEWLLSGNGKMKVNKHNQLSPLERCLLEVSLSSIQKWHLLEILIIEKINKRNFNSRYIVFSCRILCFTPIPFITLVFRIFKQFFNTDYLTFPE